MSSKKWNWSRRILEQLSAIRTSKKATQLKSSRYRLPLAVEMLEDRWVPNGTNFGFALNLGGSSSSATATGVTADSSDNVYVTGFFQGTVKFDATHSLTSTSTYDNAFVAKYSSSGALFWVDDLGKGGYAVGYGIAVDGSGNVYTTGNFSGTASFSGTGSGDNLTALTDLTGSGESLSYSYVQNAYVSKLNSSGAFVWAEELGTGSSDVYADGIGIALDSSGDVYTTGVFFGTGSFSGSGSGDNRTSEGSYNAYVSKLNSSGAFVWGETLGGGNNSQAAVGQGIAVDGAGNVYTTGRFEGSGSFSGTGSGDELTTDSLGGYNAYVSKLNSNGGYVWADDLGSDDNGTALGYAIALDGSNDVYTTGYFEGTGSFSGTGSGDNLTSNPSTSDNAYVSKLTAAGTYVWAKELGGGAGIGYAYGEAVAVDAVGNVYTTGEFDGTGSFSGSGTGGNLTAGSENAFVSKLGASGGFEWADNLGSGSTSTLSYDIAEDSSGNVYTTGNFAGTGSFSGSSSGDNLTSVGGSGNTDGFVSQLVQIGSVITQNSAGIPANAATLTITGVGFDPSGTNSVVLSSGVGTVTTVTSTSLTIAFTAPPTAGNLTAVVYTDGLSSGKPVQVATVEPVVTGSTADLAANAPTFQIYGFGFDPLGTNTVVLSSGVGTVTAATATSLTITFTTAPIAGALTAIVASDGVISGSAVQVATVQPVVSPNTVGLAADASTFTISGTGFDPTGSNTVTLSSGAATVTAVTATTITVKFTTQPTAGPLTAIVTTDDVSSSAVQVATIVPAVTKSGSNLAANSSTLTIYGYGFDPNGTVTVELSSGVGTVTSVTATSLTITFTTLPTAGTLTIIVIVDGVSSGTAVQVAEVIPVVTANGSSWGANNATLTIEGAGFGPSGTNTIELSSGVGTVTSVTGTSLTITFTTLPSVGNLTIIVIVDGVSSGSAVEVATVLPAVTESGSSLAAGATTLTIEGFGFDPSGTNVVELSSGVGSVTSVTGTSLTITFTTLPTLGNLTVIVIVDGVSSGSAVQVGTIVPAVSESSSGLAANSTGFTIEGFGFDPSGTNTVELSSGVGSVTSVTATSLTITFATLPTAGTLTVIVIVDGVSSGSAVEVATILPVITQNSSNLAANSSTLTIDGFGFDPSGTNTVELSSGVAAVTSVTATSLTITFTTAPTGGALSVIVITDGASSSSPVLVARVIPVVTSNDSNWAASSSTLTIEGYGFGSSGNDAVELSSGVGTITSATATSLTITFSTAPTAGTLTVIVIVDGVSSGSAVEVATIVPTVTESTSSLAANSSTLTIQGFGLDPSGTNTVELSSGLGTVTSVTATSLTISFSTLPSLGSLTVIVTTDGMSSGGAVQVGTVVPVVTENTSSLAANTSTLTIVGFGFDPSGSNAVELSSGIGTVTAVTANSITITFSTLPRAGTLTVIVTVDGISSGNAVQVATVVPVVTSNGSNLVANSSTLTIVGFGFDPSGTNTVELSSGVGAVTSVTATSLTITLSTAPTAGTLTVIVTTNGVNSGSAIEVATILPVVFDNSGNLPANASNLTILGVGFDPSGTNSVELSSGVGTVTSATATSLTIALSSLPAVGTLTVIVSVDGISSGSAIEVATVVPVVFENSDGQAANLSTLIIAGAGFDPSGSNTVELSSGVGTVTSVDANSLTITFSTLPTAGSLTVIVAIDGVSSGSAIQVATILPVTDQNTSSIAANSNTLTIEGFGFDPAGTNTVELSSGVGTVTAVTATSLTITFSTAPTAGSLTVIVSVDGVSSGSAIEVATVLPVVFDNSTSLAANSSTLTILGVGFDPNGTDSVELSSGVGTVTSVTATSLTISLSSLPSVGTLTVIVSVDGASSGSAVEVATVVPVVVESGAGHEANASTLTIAGFGFDPSGTNDVELSSGVGTVTSVDATSLTITFTTLPTAGSLSVIVEVDGISSGSAVEAASVLPVVKANSASLPAESTTLTIEGFGFDPSGTNAVEFSSGIGTVTAVTATSLTILFTSAPNAGTLTAMVTTNGVGSGSAIQVAEVVPTLDAGTTVLPVGATTLTIEGSGFDLTSAQNSVTLSDATTNTATLTASGVSVNATGTQLTVTFTSSGLVGGDAIDATVTIDGAVAGPTQVAQQATSAVDIVNSTVTIGGTSGLVVTLQPENASGQDIVDGSLGSNIAFTYSGPTGGTFGPVSYDPITGTYSSSFTPPLSGGGPYRFGSTVYGVAFESNSSPVNLVPTAARSALSLSSSGIDLSNPTSTVILQVADQFGDALNVSGLTAAFSVSSSQVSFRGTFALDSTTIAVAGSAAGLGEGQTITGPGIAAGSTIAGIEKIGSTTALTISEPTSGTTAVAFAGSFAKGSRSIVVVGSATGLAVGVPITGAGIAAGSTITAVTVKSGKTTLALSHATTAASTGGASGQSLAANPPATLSASTGIVGTATDGGNGTYTANFTDTNLDDATISATLDGSPVASPLSVPASFSDSFSENRLSPIWVNESGKLTVGLAFEGTYAANSTTIDVSGSATGLIVGQTLTGPGIASGTAIVGVSVSRGITVLSISKATTAASTIDFNGTFAKGSRSIVVVGSASGLAVGVPIRGQGIPAGATITKVTTTGSTTALTISQATTAASTGGLSGQAIVASSAAALVASGDALAAAGTDLAVLAGIVQANVSESMTVAHLASGQTAELVARYQGPTTSNYYAAGIANVGGKLFAQIYKNVNGVLTLLGKVAVPAGALTITGTGSAAVGSGTIRFDVVSASLRLYAVHGSTLTLLLAEADTSITLPGSVGIRAIGTTSISGFAAQEVSLLAPGLPFQDFTSSTPTADGQLSLNWIDEAGDFVTNNSADLGAAVGTNATANLAVLSDSVAGTDLQVLANVSGLRKSGATAGLVAAYSGSGNSNYYSGRIENVSGKFVAQIVENLKGTLKVLSSETIASTSLTNSGSEALELEIAANSGGSVTLTLLANGGTSSGGETLTYTASSSTALAVDGSIGISGTAGTSFSDFDAT